MINVKRIIKNIKVRVDNFVIPGSKQTRINWVRGQVRYFIAAAKKN
jgi:hypothetical protein